MSSGTVLIWGVASTILLICSCIVLNAQTYYQELENKSFMESNTSFKVSYKIILRDHQTHKLEMVNSNE